MNYRLEIAFHWPHDRLALGWESVMPDENHDYSTFKLYLLVITITLDLL